MAVFAHEYAHSFVASIFSFKKHFWQMKYRNIHFLYLLLLINIDKHVNYSVILAAYKDWLLVLNKFVGSSISNGLTYVISLGNMANSAIRSWTWLFYFFFWWNVNSIGNSIGYLPCGIFGRHVDIK